MRVSNKIALSFVALIGAFGFYILMESYQGEALALNTPSKYPLWYSGLLVDNTGKALTGTKVINIVLYDSVSAGKKLCVNTPVNVSLVIGRFRFALDKQCAFVVGEHKDVWIEVVVDTVKMPRTKIGSVPYVVNHNTIAANGDASFQVHSNSDTLTKNKKMLELRTGKSKPEVVFGVDNVGEVIVKEKVVSRNIGNTIWSSSTSGTFSIPQIVDDARKKGLPAGIYRCILRTSDDRYWIGVKFDLFANQLIGDSVFKHRFDNYLSIQSMPYPLPQNKCKGVHINIGMASPFTYTQGACKQSIRLTCNKAD